MSAARSGCLRRWGKRIGIVALILCAAALAPVIWVESSCYAPQSEPDGFRSRLPAEARRAEVNSYLTYPEWSIVHAYQDLAAVTRRTSESDFDYWSRIGGYWTSLCHIVGYASEKGSVSGEYRSMLHIIGVSFSVEMAVKGLYERTIGRLTVWMRGNDKTAEDEFALKVADDYAGFLRQTPWYEYPFMTRLSEFWSETPFGSSSWLRAIERRAALTLEYAGKAVYAQAIGALAGAAPAELRIRSVVTGGDPSGIDGVQIIRQLDGDEGTVIETARYAAFTQIARKLASAGMSFSEIAGNDDIMVAVLAPSGKKPEVDGASELFSVPLDARPGWRRIMMTVRVDALTQMISALHGGQFEVEHIYDY